LGGRDYLRVYGSLSAEQRKALQSEGGLPFDQLTNTQWELLGNLIAERLGGVYLVGGNLQLSLTPWAKFQVTAQVGGEEKPRSFSQSIMIVTKDDLASMREAEKTRGKATQPQPGQNAPAPAPGLEE